MNTALIDINTRFGYDPRSGVMTAPEEVKRAGRKWGVVRAYTCSMKAILFDCQDGNQETLDLCAADEYFRPVAVACPTGIYTPTRAHAIRDLGFAIARLFPDVHGYAVDSTACARLVESLAEAGIAVMLPTAASETARLAHLLRGREGAFILTHNRYAVLGDLLALADFLPSVYVELSDLMTPDGIAAVAGAFSPSRLLWGSNYPILNVGSSAMVLRGSGLPPDQMEMAAAGNARRVLEAAR
jgi:predicted TIM-barrel fold metal-dependent hydrolase